MSEAFRAAPAFHPPVGHQRLDGPRVKAATRPTPASPPQLFVDAVVFVGQRIEQLLLLPLELGRMRGSMDLL
jgi:hypothetical protein